MAVWMTVLKMIASSGILTDSQPQLADLFIDKPLFAQVIWAVSGNKMKKRIKARMSY